MPLKQSVSDGANIVIGHSLPSLIFSYLNDFPIIINKKAENNLFDLCSPHLDFNQIDLDCYNLSLNSVEGVSTFGCPKTHVKNQIIMCLSMSGLILNSVTFSNIKISQNQIECYSKSKKYPFAYKKIHIFNSENVSGISLEKQNVFYEVYDKIHMKHSNQNSVEFIETGDNFVNKIYIYPSKRNGAKKTDRDIICKSILSREQLDSFEYSDTISRMKVASLMRQAGFEGSKSGPNKSNPKIHNRRELLLVSASRSVCEKYTLKCKDIISDIVINNSTEEQIICKYGKNASSARNLNSMLKNVEVL
tara:strand:+ start:779 stop:1693 length:915 start_codon:yes stop_codon:yes gene_type:complete